LLRPTYGEIVLGSHEVTAMNERALLALRRNEVSVLAQGSGANLLPYLSPIENVRFARNAGHHDAGRGGPFDAAGLLAQVGLSDHADSLLRTLSGGEQQRLSVAAALATDPTVLLVDEPTSQLDSGNRDRVIDLLLDANERSGVTIVIVTHDPAVADRVDREIHLRDGMVLGSSR
jgi:ABC-type lipoprotein export system ATPase subunit